MCTDLFDRQWVFHSLGPGIPVVASARYFDLRHTILPKGTWVITPRILGASEIYPSIDSSYQPGQKECEEEEVDILLRLLTGVLADRRIGEARA